MKPIIACNNIYKKYSIGLKKPYLNLSESLKDIFTWPNFSRQFNKLKLQKDEFWALKNISFEVFPGEAVGVIGRNGAGKSTLLKILSQITPPTKGEIYLRGRVASLLEIGTGFQQELTGRENIFLNGAILGMTQNEIKRKFAEIVEFSSIEKFLDTQVKYYSSGMYMRLAFSIAAHIESEILIIDEVLAVGDASFQKKCLGKMENAAQSGRTVLFVSHNMGAIRNTCRNTILLDAGNLIFFGPTGKALDLYNVLLREIKVDDKTQIDNQNVRRGSGAIRFTNIEITDVRSKRKYDFFPEETVRFKLSYKIFKEMKGLIVSISLRSGITRELVTTIRHSLSEDLQIPGTVGNLVIELPLKDIRPGEYPLYFHISEKYGQKTNVDVIDDLTAPLIIQSRNKLGDPDISQNQFTGYFSMESDLVLNNIN